MRLSLALVLLVGCRGAPDPMQLAGGGAAGGTAGGGAAGGSAGGGSVIPPACEYELPPSRSDAGVCSDDGRDGGPRLTAGLTVPERQPPPISGGTMTVTRDKVIVAADSDRDEVWLVFPDDTKHRVALSAGDEPGRALEGPSGRVFVALRGAAAVAELDVATHTLVTRHPVCDAPRGLAWLPADDTLAVACANGELAHVKPGGATTRRFIREDLRDVVLLPDGGLLVSTFRAAGLLTVDASGNVGVDSQLAIPDSGSPAGVAWRLISSPRGPVLLHQLQSPSRLEAADCKPGYAEPAPLQATMRILGATAAPMALGYGPRLLVDVAVSDDGTQLMVASPGDGVVTWSHLVSGAGEQLTGLGQPVSVAFRDSTPVVFSREPSGLFFITGTASRFLPLSAERRVSTGHDLFHLAAPNGLTCASCHPEAGDDGRVWNLPEGLRRTPTLRGGICGTAPFHWDGRFNRLEELYADVMVGRMGGLSQPPEKVKALLGWLHSVPKLPPPPLDEAAVIRGRTLFLSPATNCRQCHPSEQGTNNQAADIGTGGMLQVPRLVELAGRAPYFHDGRIATLADRFGPAGGAAHGNTAQLTPAELADLVTYLRSR